MRHFWIRKIRGDEVSVWSVKAKNITLDYVLFKSGYRFFQLSMHEKSVFLLSLPDPSSPVPTFFLSQKAKITHAWKRLRAGKLKSPLKTELLWGDNTNGMDRTRQAKRLQG